MYRRLTISEAFADDVHTVIPMGDAVPVILDTPKLYKWLAAQSDPKDRTLLLGTKFLTTQRRADGLYESTIRRRDSGPGKVISKYIVDASGWHFSRFLTRWACRPNPRGWRSGRNMNIPLAPMPRIAG